MKKIWIMGLMLAPVMGLAKGKERAPAESRGLVNVVQTGCAAPSHDAATRGEFQSMISSGFKLVNVLKVEKTDPALGKREYRQEYKNAKGETIGTDFEQCYFVFAVQ